jgi:hypothetical protein
LGKGTLNEIGWEIGMGIGVADGSGRAHGPREEGRMEKMDRKNRIKLT